MTISARVKQWNIVGPEMFPCYLNRTSGNERKHLALAILWNNMHSAKSIQRRAVSWIVFSDVCIERRTRTKHPSVQQSLSNNSGRGTSGTNWILTLVLLHPCYYAVPLGKDVLSSIWRNYWSEFVYILACQTYRFADRDYLMSKLMWTSGNAASRWW